jgi:hypothetical protein
LNIRNPPRRVFYYLEIGMSELQILFPEPETITVQGRDVQLRPVKLRDFDRYGQAAAALHELFASASVQQINRYAQAHSAELKRVLRSTTSLNRWQLWRMPGVVAVQVMAQVMRVNAGFFGDALPAVVKALNGPMLPSD